MKAALNKLNLPKYVCNHMLGANHSYSHRVSVGIVVMVIGICVSKIPVPVFILHIICDGTGYLLHGIGAIPIIEFIMLSKPKDP